MQTGLLAIIECILVVDLTTENIELSLQYVPRVFPCRALINKQKSGCAIMKGNISGADPGIFDWRSPNFGSERTSCLTFVWQITSHRDDHVFLNL